MNDTGGGVTAIHDVPGDITRIGFHWMLFFPFCHSKGVLLFCLHTECLGDHGGSSCHEFANFVFTRRISEVTDFLCPEYFPCPEFSNFRIVSFTRSVADGCGACSSCEWGTIRRCL